MSAEPTLYRVVRTVTTEFLVRAASPAIAESLVRPGLPAASESHVLVLALNVAWETKAVALWHGEVQ